MKKFKNGIDRFIDSVRRNAALVAFCVLGLFAQVAPAQESGGLPDPSTASAWDPSSVTTTVGPYLDTVLTTVLGILGMLLIFVLVRFGYRQVVRFLGK